MIEILREAILGGGYWVLKTRRLVFWDMLNLQTSYFFWGLIYSYQLRNPLHYYWENWMHSCLKVYKGEQFSQIWMPTCDSFWVPNEIKSWDFQHMIHLWFREASQNLSSFRQLFFHSFQGGTKGKMLKKECTIILAIFSAFFLWSPLGKYEKKVV